MEKKIYSNCSSAQVDYTGSKDEFQELLQTLEQTNGDSHRFVKYDAFWFLIRYFRPVLSVQKFFKAKETDIILASLPKSGTTWLKALTFCITNRKVYTIDKSPLLTCHPHKIMPFLEFDIYLDQENPDLQHLPSPTIFSTHIPLRVLPDSVRKSKCKIIYICRNPLDQFISRCQFYLVNEKIERDALPLGLKESFDLFCEGIHMYGPFWDHILEYWNAHLENPQKVLFLMYEDLKEDITFHVKKIAEFLGCPFSLEEEKLGLVEEISRFCSFENLRNLEVNKNGYILGVKYSSFYRKGEVGDWTNYLTPDMAERIEKIMESKLEGSGLKLKTYRKIS